MFASALIIFYYTAIEKFHHYKETLHKSQYLMKNLGIMIFFHLLHQKNSF